MSGYWPDAANAEDQGASANTAEPLQLQLQLTQHMRFAKCTFFFCAIEHWLVSWELGAGIGYLREQPPAQG